MAKKRAAIRDLAIPLPANPDRRNECLADGLLFLKTYFPATFHQPFTEDRKAMLQSIIDAARYGGDYAIAGPRGEGKTRLAIYGALFLMFANLSTFPVVIGKSQTKSQNELKTIKERLQQSDLLIADFPEVGVPFQSVGGWSSRCRMQTVAGKSTNIEIAADHLIFPTITKQMLPADWPLDCEPTSRGQIMSSLGIDGPIRGTNYRDSRPTLAILDDIESKESAASDVVIQSNEQIIEKDVSGLGSSGRRVSRVMLCTTQNRKCIAYKYTDREIKSSWNGVRFRKMVHQPERMDLWDEYIERRINRKENDGEARNAFRFYLERREQMDRGCVISNPFSFDTRKASDGEPLELSAVQGYFNRVADFGKDAVATEDDNEPPEAEGPQTSGLSPGIIQSRMSGLAQRQMPANTTALTVGIDVGKYLCHYTVTAWWKGAGGCVIDYGIAEVKNTSPNMTNESSERAIYSCLVNWRDELLGTSYVDASGAQRTIDAVFVDSGAFTDAVYEFVRQVGGAPFYATKGIGAYRQPKETETTKVGSHLHATNQQGEGLWLYNLDADYWKRFVHERFLTPTFDDNNLLRPGSLSIFQPTGSRAHISFSNHITAEEYVSEFKPGKGEKCYWIAHNRNNHWLDSTAMATAAATLKGVSVMTNLKSPKLQATQATKAKAKARNQQHAARSHGRKDGWVQGVRRTR